MAETERISLAAMGRILLGLSVRKLGGAMSFPNAGISYLQLAVESIGVRLDFSGVSPVGECGRSD